MEETRKNKIKLIVWSLAAVLFVIGAMVILDIKRQEQTEDFIQKEIGGILESLQYAGHNEYDLTIRQRGEKLKYYLCLNPFIDKYGILSRDSIAKDAQSTRIRFYKKKNGMWTKCCEFNYGID